MKGYVVLCADARTSNESGLHWCADRHRDVAMTIGVTI
jgi:hypothetical protein